MLWHGMLRVPGLFCPPGLVRNVSYHELNGPFSLLTASTMS